MKSISKIWQLMIFALLGCCIISCQDKTAVNSLGPLPTASFTATPLASNPNKIVVQSTTKDAFMWQWDFGNGSTATNETDTVVYISKGVYTVQLTVFSHGGYAKDTQNITIANDITGTNLLQDSGKLDASDWTILNTGGSQTQITFSNNTAVFSNTGDSNGGMYQAVKVDSGVQYRFSATVQGSGATNSWFEVYLGTTVPTQGSDYTDNKFVSLNTWSGCGTSAFDGDISTIGCSGSGTGMNGIITFQSSGTVYLVIKAGSSGGTLGSGGVTLKNVSLIKI